MKKLILIALICGCAARVYSQTAKEWVQQKKTGIEYLVNQIVGLRAYASVVSKGYQTAKNGLATINRIKEGDFSLHKDRFEALLTVSPTVAASTAVQETAAQCSSMQAGISRVQRLCDLKGGLNAEERRYVRSVLTGLKKLAATAIENLKIVSESGHLSLSDDERLKRIVALQTEIKEAHLFLQSFKKQAKLLAISRLKDSKDARVLKELYGIK